MESQLEGAKKMQLTGELPDLKVHARMGDQEKQGHLAELHKMKGHGKAPAALADGQPKNLRPKLVRMKDLKISDYYTGSDREKDERAVEFFLKRDKNVA